MPGRKVHTGLTAATAAMILPISLVAGLGPLYAGLVTGGCLITVPVRIKGVAIYLNPDMDIRINDSKLARAFGIETYRKAIPHRSGLKAKNWKLLWRKPWAIFFFSHIPFVGTLPRLALLILALIFPVLALGQEELLSLPVLFFLWLGMSLSDTVHALADLYWSWYKKDDKGDRRRIWV